LSGKVVTVKEDNQAMKKADPIKLPTIRDVAQHAGVSHTTVSFVLNNVTTETISPGTRERVLNAIKELDYHPREAARMLNRRSSQQIGLAIPESHNAHYQEIAAGAEMYAEQHGFGVFQTNTHFDIEREKRCFDWLKQQRVDGLILIPSSGTRLNEELDKLFEAGYPIVTLGVFESRVDNVRAELAKGERQVLEHLIGLGHRRIGYIHGVANHAVFDYRLDTCLNLQRELGLEVVDAWVRRCGPGAEDGYEATRTLLRDCQGAERPTALVVVNDLLASATIASLYAAGIRAPEGMSVATFDNTRLAVHTVTPPLTSIDYKAQEMGMCAAELVISRLANRERPRAQLEMRAQLVVRGSTGPAPD
jgi:DNA-binding LacI/PurR family transcriptional regulator